MVEPLQPKQLEEIRRLASKRVDPTFNFEKEAFEATRAILTPSQRLASAHKMHLTVLEHDLIRIVEPKVARYLELPAEILPTMRLECEKNQKEINALRFELELKVFNETYRSISKDSQHIIKKLFDRVWCELE